MEEFYGSFQVCNGHKHVLEMTWYVPVEPESHADQKAALLCFAEHPTDLDHMLSFIKPLQSFALSKLEQRDLEKQ